MDGSTRPGGPARPANPWEDFEALAHLAPESTHDAYSQKRLRKGLWDLGHRAPRTLARLRWESGGVRYPNLAKLLLLRPTPPEVTVEFVEGSKELSDYEFACPARSITFREDGPGTLHRLEVDDPAAQTLDESTREVPEEVLVRFAFREVFIPRSLAEEQRAQDGLAVPSPPFGLCSWKNLHRFVHRYGVVPYRVELLAYTHQKRDRFELDLLLNRWLEDPRAGRLPLGQRTARSARLSAGLDRYVAKLELPVIPRRALEILFETERVTPAELSQCLEVSHELARSALETLRAHGLAETEGAPPVYRALEEPFLTPEEWAKEHPSS